MDSINQMGSYRSILPGCRWPWRRNRDACGAPAIHHVVPCCLVSMVWPRSPVASTELHQFVRLDKERFVASTRTLYQLSRHTHSAHTTALSVGPWETGARHRVLGLANQSPSLFLILPKKTRNINPKATRPPDRQSSSHARWSLDQSCFFNLEPGWVMCNITWYMAAHLSAGRAVSDGRRRPQPWAMIASNFPCDAHLPAAFPLSLLCPLPVLSPLPPPYPPPTPPCRFCAAERVGPLRAPQVGQGEGNPQGPAIVTTCGDRKKQEVDRDLSRGRGVVTSSFTIATLSRKYFAFWGHDLIWGGGNPTKRY
ncbi:hypothetical protein GGTG_01875 [Gaeumannomyces tritici R3-111a-1]|uniref:Uncharacterized protein n=1 Tax=Gaeumannomyces tritici (strain R3-111a-1) TaxID=644352 RepID=J3NKT4_GAET3|nr:hypothetical protein GGTG_01875 [Gaeumannomyces tritici R3-111a-1]EJT81901.1 hypothetical protein GGTG_01875 [Gaeumannomyces tritici R3-111a-1]